MYQPNSQFPARAVNPNHAPQMQDPSLLRAPQPSNASNQNPYVQYPGYRPQTAPPQLRASYSEHVFPVNHHYPTQTDYPPANSRDFPPTNMDYPISRELSPVRMDYPHKMDYPISRELSPVRMDYPHSTDCPINRDYPTAQFDHPPHNTSYNRDYPSENMNYSPGLREYQTGNNRYYNPGNDRDYNAGNDRDYNAGGRDYLAADNVDYPRPSRKSVPGPLDPTVRWDCFYCPLYFEHMSERDGHSEVCPDRPQDGRKGELYESIDHPKPTRVLLIWKKEKRTLETEVQFYIKDGDPIALQWNDKEVRFQEEVELKVGEHSGLLNVSDINLTADVHSFYVAPGRLGVGSPKVQNIELEIDDEEDLLKKPEKLIGAEEEKLEGKEGAETKDAKTKKLSRKKKVDKEPVLQPQPELVVYERQVDPTKKNKSSEKKLDSLQKECEKLREQNKKLVEESTRMKNQSKAREEDIKRFEIEREKLAKSGAELKKDLETRAAVCAAKKQLDKAYDECRANLETRDKECRRLEQVLDRKDRETIDLSQQLASLNAISELHGHREDDQQKELIEKRERVTKLQSELRTQERRAKFQEEEWQRESEEQKAMIKQQRDHVSKLEKICESLRRENDNLQKSTVMTRDAAAMRHRSQLPDTPGEAGITKQEREGGEGQVSNEVRILKKQLSQVGKERDQLLLKYNAAKIDMKVIGGKNSKEESKQKDAGKKNKNNSENSNVPELFLGIIELQDKELEQLRIQLREMREQNFKLENAKELMIHELDKLRNVPCLTEPLKLSSQCRVPNSPLTSLSSSPTSAPMSLPQFDTLFADNPLEGPSNPKTRRLSLQTGDVVLDLPPPINFPKKGAVQAGNDFKI